MVGRVHYATAVGNVLVLGEVLRYSWKFELGRSGCGMKPPRLPCPFVLRAAAG